MSDGLQAFEYGAYAENKESDFLWEGYRKADLGGVPRRELFEELENEGLSLKDTRLREFCEVIRKAGNPEVIDWNLWTSAVSKDRVLIEKALTGNLVVPDWQSFCEEIEKCAEHARPCRGGATASYIPELANVDPELYAVSVCTVDGQIFNYGDYDVDYCIQSCSKPVTYTMAVMDQGLDEVHKHVGREPSGQIFNKLTLKEVEHDDAPSIRQVPHNPMINAGAIMSIALVSKNKDGSNKNPTEVYSEIKNTFQALCGDKKIGFQNATYLSEKDTADRNFCLAYMMREMGAFPDGSNVKQVLDSYFQICSLEMNCENMATWAATFANGGMCPTTNKVVFDAESVRSCLSLMLSCGMYDYSGEWAFSVGLPAKSGVGGSVFVVIPNKMGISIYSPRLDKMGNSVRGVEFAKKLVETFAFHHLDILRGVGHKIDPCQKQNRAGDATITQLLFACSRGDLREVKRLLATGARANDSDYDNRSPLHLAAAENRTSIVRYLCEEYRSSHELDVNYEDRWGRTALDETSNEKIVDILKRAGGKPGSGVETPIEKS